MEALHAVISMPPSRRGSPPGSPTVDTTSYDFYPALQSRRGSKEGRENVTSLDTSGNATAGGATTLSTSPLAAVQDPSLTQHVQQLHGYTPAAQGQRRTIDDFEIIDDIGRGAYGLVGGKTALRVDQVGCEDGVDQGRLAQAGLSFEQDISQAIPESGERLAHIPTHMTLNWKPRFKSFRSICEVILSKPTWLWGKTVGC